MERRLGREYYYTQRFKINTIYDKYYAYLYARNLDISIKHAVGIFAALSPNNDEDSNYADLETVLRDTNPTTSAYPSNLSKALRILHGENPLSVITGQKTRAFYLNTVNPYHTDLPVTIDGHMIGAFLGRRIKMRSREASLSKSGYSYIRQAVIEAAAIPSISIYPPCDFQAIIWLTWKRMNNVRYTPQLRLFDRHEMRQS